MWQIVSKNRARTKKSVHSVFENTGGFTDYIVCCHNLFFSPNCLTMFIDVKKV